MASRHHKGIIAAQSYLLRASFNGLESEPVSSPIDAEVGRVELTQPGGDFYVNGDLFVRGDADGASFDTFAIGADDAGAALPVVNGTLVLALVSAVSSKGTFGIGTTKTGAAAPRIEWEAFGGRMQIAGIRTTSGSFVSHSKTVDNPALLWLLWTDALYFGVNDEVIRAQAVAPSGSRYPSLARQLGLGEWRCTLMLWRNDYTDFLTGITAPYTLSESEYAQLTRLLGSTGGSSFYAAP